MRPVLDSHLIHRVPTIKVFWASADPCSRKNLIRNGYVGNVFFRIKIVMMLVAGVNAGVFALATAGGVADWNLQPRPPFKARFAGAASLSLWGGIVVAGRLIAYNWFN